MTRVEKARGATAKAVLGTARAGYLRQSLSWPAAALLIIAVSVLLWFTIGAAIVWLIG